MCADSFKSYASADVKPTLHAVGFSRPYAGDAPNAGVGPVNSMLLTSLLMPLSGSNFGWYIVPFRGFIKALILILSYHIRSFATYRLNLRPKPLLEKQRLVLTLPQNLEHGQILQMKILNLFKTAAIFSQLN